MALRTRMETTLRAELVGRISEELGLPKAETSDWLDWLEGVVCAIRVDDYNGFPAREAPIDRFNFFATLTQDPAPKAGSIHEGLEKLLLSRKAREISLYLERDRSQGGPCICIGIQSRRS